MSDEDLEPVGDSRAVSRRAFMAAAAGLAAAWAGESVAAPRRRHPGEARPTVRRKAAAATTEIEKDKATLRQSVDAIRKFELAETAEPATWFVAGPLAGRR